MVIDQITQYILALTPAVTALVGIIVVVGVGVGKVKSALKDNEQTVERTSKSDRELKRQLAEVCKQNAEIKRENAEIKHSLNELNSKIQIIDIIKAKDKRK